jgi:hypothetical protein
LAGSRTANLESVDAFSKAGRAGQAFVPIRSKHANGALQTDRLGSSSARAKPLTALGQTSQTQLSSATAIRRISSLRLLRPFSRQARGSEESDPILRAATAASKRTISPSSPAIAKSRGSGPLGCVFLIAKRQLASCSTSKGQAGQQKVLFSREHRPPLPGHDMKDPLPHWLVRERPILPLAQGPRARNRR